MRQRLPARRPLTVAVPWPAESPRRAIVPVFLPFFGCPRRCLFCAQDAQTGQPPAGGAELPALLASARVRLEQRAARGLPPCELAFYGGTFTALPGAALATCLAFAAEARRLGLVTSFRCSTRPDAVDAGLLSRLGDAGCAMVELGVQSFSERALGRAARGYDAARARLACALVAASGLDLGVQLLPGMPGCAPQDFLADVRAGLELGARVFRFYPCLVLARTGLAALWERGEYTPWPMEQTLDALAAGWLLARKGRATVARMGVAPGEDLERALLAGPWHPALGSRVLGRALLRAVADMLARCGARDGGEPVRLEVPAAAQGHFWGHAGELRPRWAALGITPQGVRFVRAPRLRLTLGA